MELKLPMGFSRDFSWKARVKYRNFVGKKRKATAAGEKLSQEQKEDPVWIFLMRESDITEKTALTSKPGRKMILDSGVKKKKYCGLCNSESLKRGASSTVFEIRILVIIKEHAGR